MPPLLADGRGRRLIGIVACALGQGAAAAVAAIALRVVFGALHADAAVPAPAVVALAVAGLGLAVARVAERAAAEALGWDYAAAVRRRLLLRLSRLSARQLARRRPGTLSLRFVADLAAVRHWIARGLARLLAAAIVAPLVLGALALWDGYLAAAVAVPMLAGLAAMAWLGRRLEPAHRDLRALRGRLAAELADRAPIAPELRLVGRIAKETEALERRATALREAAVRHRRAASTVRAVADGVWGLAAAALVATTLAVDASASDLAMALALCGLLLHPLRDLAGVADRWRAWRVAAERIGVILAEPVLPRPERTGGARRRRPRKPAALAFIGVRGPGVRLLDATVAAGEKVALTGPVGAGKSAVLALAAGLEAPEAGRVTLGGVPVLALGAVARARAIAYVGPRAPILRGSLRRALSLGVSPRPDDEALRAAATRFGLAAALHRLGGLDGRVEEAGRNLSDGERRGLILARAAVHRPALLLLDDPTAGLSPAVRAEVLALVQGSSATVLAATHDPGLARLLDRVWRIEDGMVVARDRPRPEPTDGATATLAANDPSGA